MATPGLRARSCPVSSRIWSEARADSRRRSWSSIDSGAAELAEIFGNLPDFFRSDEGESLWEVTYGENGSAFSEAKGRRSRSRLDPRIVCAARGRPRRRGDRGRGVAVDPSGGRFRRLRPRDGPWPPALESRRPRSRVAIAVVGQGAACRPMDAPPAVSVPRR